MLDRLSAWVTIYNPESIEALRNCTMISVVISENSGNSLGAIILRQLPNLHWRDWGRLEARVYLGDYSLRGREIRGLATALVSGPQEDLSIQFNPAIEPGQTVSVVFRGFTLGPVFINGQQNSWRMLRIPFVMSNPPPLRLNVYEQNPYR